eukprot:maker-scaffold_2-snap-gene-7.16-mRNA-1 protein AED:0.26 eAED:0.26 QI:86/1/1/1/1/1/2/70/438
MNANVENKQTPVNADKVMSQGFDKNGVTGGILNFSTQQQKRSGDMVELVSSAPVPNENQVPLSDDVELLVYVSGLNIPQNLFITWLRTELAFNFQQPLPLQHKPSREEKLDQEGPNPYPYCFLQFASQDGAYLASKILDGLQIKFPEQEVETKLVAKYDKIKGFTATAEQHNVLQFKEKLCKPEVLAKAVKIYNSQEKRLNSTDQKKEEKLEVKQTIVPDGKSANGDPVFYDPVNKYIYEFRIIEAKDKIKMQHRCREILKKKVEDLRNKQVELREKQVEEDLVKKTLESSKKKKAKKKVEKKPTLVETKVEDVKNLEVSLELDGLSGKRTTEKKRPRVLKASIMLQHDEELAQENKLKKSKMYKLPAEETSGREDKMKQKIDELVVETFGEADQEVVELIQEKLETGVNRSEFESFLTDLLEEEAPKFFEALAGFLS